MRASFDYADDRMRSVDELLFNYNKDKPTVRRISKSELLRKLLDMVGSGRLALEKVINNNEKR